jgi:hypothetical protein
MHDPPALAGEDHQHEQQAARRGRAAPSRPEQAEAAVVPGTTVSGLYRQLFA